MKSSLSKWEVTGSSVRDLALCFFQTCSLQPEPMLPQVRWLEDIRQTSLSSPWSRNVYVVQLPNSCKHTLMCKVEPFPLRGRVLIFVWWIVATERCQHPIPVKWVVICTCKKQLSDFNTDNVTPRHVPCSGSPRENRGGWEPKTDGKNGSMERKGLKKKN